MDDTKEMEMNNVTSEKKRLTKNQKKRQNQAQRREADKQAGQVAGVYESQADMIKQIVK